MHDISVPYRLSGDMGYFGIFNFICTSLYWIFFIYLCIFLHLHFNYLYRHATPAKVIIKKNKKLLAVSVPDTWLAHLFFAFLPYDTF